MTCQLQRTSVVGEAHSAACDDLMAGADLMEKQPAGPEEEVGRAVEDAPKTPDDRHGGLVC